MTRLICSSFDRHPRPGQHLLLSHVDPAQRPAVVRRQDLDALRVPNTRSEAP